MATLVLEHSALAGSMRLGEILRDHGHRLRVVRLHDGDALPADLDDVDAIVTCGGSLAPLDEPEWMAGELELLREAHARVLPIVGLCLGCQLLARALGGTVAPLEGGIEAGWHEVALTPSGREDPLFAGIAWTSMQPHWHRYHVEAAPEGARVLARSDRTPVQAWSLGLRTYGIQYHPEIHADTMEAWADDEPEAVREASLTRDRLRSETEAHYPACERLATRLFTTMALVLMPLDRRYAGIARDLHH